MKIQINTDHNINNSEGLRTSLTSLITKELNRFKEHISRLEVHMSDENGPKEGLDDKRCMIEARIKGKQPIAVTNHDNTYQQASTGAVDKLKVSPDTIFGRLKNY